MVIEKTCITVVGAINALGGEAKRISTKSNQSTNRTDEETKFSVFLFTMFGI